ncbi:MAG: aminoacyl-tRNA hydrolase [bacterium]|nr:aminoacyl-tRNA hydrolase [bacterium]
MKIIVGLGNPGVKFRENRHNAGFMTLDKVAKETGINIKTRKFDSIIGRGFIGKDEVILAKPQTFVNLSGQAVSKLVNFYKMNLEDLIVVYDDADIEFGRIKVKKNGKSSGHNGVESIIDALSNENFPRIRIGIGRSSHYEDLKKYVLSNFDKLEKNKLDKILSKVLEAIIIIIRDGIDRAMCTINALVIV